MFVTKRNGSKELVNLDKINRCAARACKDLADVSVSEVVLDAHVQMYDGITTTEIDKALILSAKAKIEKEPNYSKVAARLLLDTLYKEVFSESIASDTLEDTYRTYFVDNIYLLVAEGRYDKRMLEYDLDLLSKELRIERDLNFKYLGLQTLYDRYFIQHKSKRRETPQAFWMRVAMGISYNESKKEEAVLEFYHAMSQFKFIPSTPTLFNAGTTHPQCSSCYISTLHDSTDGIMGTLHEQALLSKFAGGLGMDWTPIGASGRKIETTNGKSGGVIPFLKIYNSILLAFDQAGLRKGAGVAYLETWHLDIEEFLQIKKNTGDDRRRCHDTNTALWIPDLFMQYAKEDKEWYLFCPKEVPHLHELYGEEFNDAYYQAIQDAKQGKIRHKKVSAKVLYKAILTQNSETGQYWQCWKDAHNIRHTNKHVAPVHSSNLCTETSLHNEASQFIEHEIILQGETAVCNLNSPNLLAHADKFGRLNLVDLARTIRLCVRAADNIIPINFYPTNAARKFNLRHRPIGVGCMGFQDLLHLKGIPYDSEEAVKLADFIQEFIAYYAIDTSAMLAKERGKYETYEGSEWSKGNLPQDTYINLMKYRGQEVDYSEKIYWNLVRNKVKKFGIRNSNVMAIAPTATISYIAGCSQSIEPDYAVLHVYSTLSGNFTMINEHFVRKMKQLGLWCPELIAAIKTVDGDIELLKLPAEVKSQYKHIFRRDMFKLIDCNAARQKWVDQAISFNMYSNKPSLKYLNDIYMYAWEKGLKSTYYLRSQAASKTEKVTSTQNTPSACSIEAMKKGEICESCQ